MRYHGLKQETDRWYRHGDVLHWRGNEIFYRDIGSGPAMLLVHGFPTAGCDWAQIAAELTPHFRLIVPDLIDYGRSLNPSRRNWHIHDQADMLEALLEHAGVSATHIVAHDVGDTICQELLARDNDGVPGFTIASLILMNGGIFPAEHRARPVQKLLLSPMGPFVAKLMGRKKFMAALAEVFGPETRPDEEAGKVIWSISTGVNGKRSFARRIHYMTDRKHYEQRWVTALKETDIRMRMINGVDDPVSGAHVCDVIATEVPHMEVIRLEGIGHFPPLEAPAQCAEHILAFHNIPADQTLV
jgi:pimeloyl-ACP methyl ester carboxylesterase